MHRASARRGYSLMELIVGLMIMGIALSLIVPRGQTTKDNATSKVTAEELVARFRQARQMAMTKSVPVAVAFPISGSVYQTDEAYFLEGEVNPQVTQRWKIQQSFKEVAYFVGTWSGPNWAAAPEMKTPYSGFGSGSSAGFKVSTWFDSVSPPPARIFAFTPAGNVISDAQAADGKFRVVVGMGVSTGGSSTLVSVNSPYTIWISPSGEVGLERGVYRGNVIETTLKETSPLASYTAPASAGNSAPVVQTIPGSRGRGAKSYPDNINPKTKNGNMIALDGVLTMEVRVKDADGDPPYFQWEAVEAAEVNPDGVSFGATYTGKAQMALWGGRFGNTNEVRMEWDAKTKEWVGRDTWAPSTKDLGGNRYKLVCTIRDRKGGVVTTGFPVDGNYLVTTKEPWVLYKTWNSAGRTELWKMTLDGLDHQRVVSFGYQNVDFGQWSPSGAEIIVGAADGVYRVSANGGNLKRIGSINLGGPVDGCCLSPAGDALYYIGGGQDSKKVRKVYFDEATRAQMDVQLPTNYGGWDYIYDLSAGQFGTKIVLMSTFYYDNKSGGLLGTGLFAKRKRYSGGVALDAGIGNANLPGVGTGPSGSWGLGSTSDKKDTPWRNLGQSGKTNYGLTMFTTNDDTVPYNIHVLYGSGGGTIYGRTVDFQAPYDVATNFKPGGNVAGFPKDTGIGDVHHPAYGSVKREDMIFVSGRGTASRIYYMPNVNSPRDVRLIPLAPAPLNNGADCPFVSRPR